MLIALFKLFSSYAQTGLLQYRCIQTLKCHEKNVLSRKIG